MDNLLSKKCIPCSIDTDPLDMEQIESYLKKVDGWELADDGRIEKTFKFKDFQEAVDFTNKLAAIAEDQDHHPSIFLAWGLARVRFWTNNIQGLHENDFIMAAKTDSI